MLLKTAFMELIPSKLPAPRLLTSLEPEPSESKADETDSQFQLRGSRLFTGNGRAIFVGLIAGAILISVGSYIFVRHERAQREEMALPKLLNVVTHTVSGSPHTVTPPAPVIVEFNSDIVRVTAIALGHPRLAVINGRAAAEGDTITVHTPVHSVAVTLRVVRIADGRVELTDGTQTIHARLAVPAPESAGAAVTPRSRYW
ncbi:MAG TPA: hypothetical protein VIV62_03555 [Chthoniobacterales bacterium]|jgi:hypothetical protein